MALSANAQTDRTLSRGAVRFVPGSSLLQTNPATGMSWQSVGSPFIGKPLESSTLTTIDDTRGFATDSISPQAVAATPAKDKKSGGLPGELHGSVSLSVMAGFGKGAPNGAGFAQDINLDYTLPLGKRGWLTAGGYLNHLNWDGINATSGGIYGELGYHFDEHWSAYIYGQKSLANSGRGYGYSYGYYYPGYWGINDYGGYNPWGDRLGAAVRWTPNHTFSLEISVEKDWLPNRRGGYFDQFNYPRPRNDFGAR